MFEGRYGCCVDSSSRFSKAMTVVGSYFFLSPAHSPFHQMHENDARCFLFKGCFSISRGNS